MKQQQIPDTLKKKLLLKDLKAQFPKMKKSELEILLLDLKRIPILFKKLITETQVNLKTYERYKKGKKVRTDYRLNLDTQLNISDGKPRRK
ncbi:MAG: hypothetical protein ABIA91_01575 [Patescibacteria group bacterium]